MFAQQSNSLIRYSLIAHAREEPIGARASTKPGPVTQGPFAYCLLEGKGVYVITRARDQTDYGYARGPESGVENVRKNYWGATSGPTRSVGMPWVKLC